jgi:hypothetical protein
MPYMEIPPGSDAARELYEDIRAKEKEASLQEPPTLPPFFDSSVDKEKPRPSAPITQEQQQMLTRQREAIIAKQQLLLDSVVTQDAEPSFPEKPSFSNSSSFGVY